MYRTSSYRPNGATMAGAIAMTAGGLIYMNDQLPKLRNFHTLLWPALALMALGVVLAVVGAVFRDRPELSRATRAR